MKDGCPFCDYAGPSEILANYGDAFIIEPLHPVVPGHLLAVATDHVEDALKVPGVASDAVSAVLDYANLSAVSECNIITSAGPAATQTIRHLHVHMVPRRPGDGLQLPWGGAL